MWTCLSALRSAFAASQVGAKPVFSLVVAVMMLSQPPELESLTTIVSVVFVGSLTG